MLSIEVVVSGLVLDVGVGLFVATRMGLRSALILCSVLVVSVWAVFCVQERVCVGKVYVCDCVHDKVDVLISRCRFLCLFFFLCVLFK